MNFLLWLIMLTVSFAMLMFAFRLWGKSGLLVWIPICCIVANIQVTKNVVLLGMEATLGNIVYGTNFLATDILSEFYGRDEARKAVWYGFFSLVAMTVLMQLALLFTPSANDTVQNSLQSIFGMMPRIAGASLIAYLASSMHDVWSYNFWKKRTDGRHLWLRNNASTLVSQVIDTTIFTLGSFAGVYAWDVLVEIMLTTYIFKALTAIADTAMIYLARKWASEGRMADIAPAKDTAV